MHGNYIIGNADNGVEISGSFANTIGGTTPGVGNVISANELAGLLIQGSLSFDNLVEGNYIGTNASGTEALGNIRGGISIGDAATNNTVGGITPEARNIISGNFGDGVSIIGTPAGPNTTDNLIEGDFIGTNIQGTGPLGNRQDGVAVFDVLGRHGWWDRPGCPQRDLRQ